MAKQCAVYEEELRRVWPSDEKRCEELIPRFAKENGFRLCFCRDGLCPILIKNLETIHKAAPQFPLDGFFLDSGVAAYMFF